MKIYNDYNKDVTPPKVEGIKVYKLLGLTQNPDGSVSGPYRHIIQSTDRVLVNGQIRDIAAIQGFDAQRNPILFDIWFERDNGWELRYDPKNIAQREIIEFLELCNANASNPNRDETVNPIFHLYDQAKESKEKVDKDRLLTKAKMKAYDWSESELKTFALARGINADQDVEILREIAASVAEADPAAFLGVQVEAEGTKALIEQAKVAGIVNFDEATKDWRWNDTGAAIYKITGQSRFAAKNFADWLDGEGAAVLVNIKSKLNK